MNTGASSRPYVLFLFNYEKVRIEQAIYRFQRLIRIISLCGYMQFQFIDTKSHISAYLEQGHSTSGTEYNLPCTDSIVHEMKNNSAISCTTDIFFP